MRYLLFIVIGYLSGSVLYSYLLPRAIRGIDITAEPEDHNPGCANAFMQAGVPVGILCVVMDLAKGFVPVYLACGMLDRGSLLFALVIAAPVVGHAFPCFAWKRGGKAIAVSFGVLLGLVPHSWMVLVLAGAYIVMSALALVVPHDHCVRSVVVYGVLAVAGIFLGGTAPIALGCLLIAAVVIFKHLSARHQPAAVLTP